MSAATHAPVATVPSLPGHLDVNALLRGMAAHELESPGMWRRDAEGSTSGYIITTSAAAR